MSKTYRRTMKGQKKDWLPNISHNDINGYYYRRYWPRDEKKVEWLNNNGHRAKDVGDYFYSHWHHDFSTVPRRAKERQLLAKIIKEEVDPEDVVWPLNDKPHVYYW